MLDPDPEVENSGAPIRPKLASTLDDYLVFPNQRLSQLMARITQLHQEKAQVAVFSCGASLWKHLLEVVEDKK